MAESSSPSGPIKSIIDSIRGRSKHLQAMGWILILGLSSGYVLRYLGASEDWLSWLDRLVVSLGFFILLFGLVWREVTRIRKEKYANIQEDLHHIQHIIRDQLTILEVMEQRDKTEVELHAHIVWQNIQECLNRLAAIFTLLTGTKCRASIKVIEPGADPDKPVVYTFLRDVDSFRFCNEDDEKRRKEGADLLEANSDFKAVFGENGGRWFFCNDLTTRASYINSRDPQLENRNLAGLQGVLNLVKPVDWRLPYRSCIVWPMRQKALTPSLGEDYELTGFLTVDSPHRRVFDEQFDTHLGAGVADSLHSMFVRLNIVGNSGGDDEQ